MKTSLLKWLLLAALCICVPASAFAQHSVALTWTASPTPSVTYNVYRGTVTGGPYSQISTGLTACCSFTDSIVSSGTTYFYVVRAFDGTVESVNSNESKAVIPQGPQPPTGLTATVK